jgi:acyl dehydratase
VLHGEQSFRLHRPLEPEGDISGETRVASLRDRGPGKPVTMHCTRELVDGATGAPVASLEELWVLRGAGGFGGEDRPNALALPAMPERAADLSLDLPTAANQAALYRLTGDRNPLHIDPATAREAGLARPILHGLATMGLVGRAIVHLVCEGDPRRLSAMRLRFTAPVLPGDVIRTELWDHGDGRFRFRASVPARDVRVIDCGGAERDRFGA